MTSNRCARHLVVVENAAIPNPGRCCSHPLSTSGMSCRLESSEWLLQRLCLCGCICPLHAMTMGEVIKQRNILFQPWKINQFQAMTLWIHPSAHKTCNQCAMMYWCVLFCIVALNVVEGPSQNQAAAHRYCFHSLGCRSPVEDSINKWLAEEENMTKNLETLHHVANYTPKRPLNHPWCRARQSSQSSRSQTSRCLAFPIVIRLSPETGSSWVQLADFMKTLVSTKSGSPHLIHLIVSKGLVAALDKSWQHTLHYVQERAKREREREIDKQTGRESFDTYDTYRVVPPCLSVDL